MNKAGIGMIGISIIIVSFYFFVANWNFENGGLIKAMLMYISSMVFLYVGAKITKSQFKKKNHKKNLWSKFK